MYCSQHLRRPFLFLFLWNLLFRFSSYLFPRVYSSTLDVDRMATPSSFPCISGTTDFSFPVHPPPLYARRVLVWYYPRARSRNYLKLRDTFFISFFFRQSSQLFELKTSNRTISFTINNEYCECASFNCILLFHFFILFSYLYHNSPPFL